MAQRSKGNRRRRRAMRGRKWVWRRAMAHHLVAGEVPLTYVNLLWELRPQSPYPGTLFVTSRRIAWVGFERRGRYSAAAGFTVDLESGGLLACGPLTDLGSPDFYLLARDGDSADVLVLRAPQRASAVVLARLFQNDMRDLLDEWYQTWDGSRSAIDQIADRSD